MKRTNANKPLIRAGLKILLLSGLLALCLCATACTTVWESLWHGESATDVDTGLLVIPDVGEEPLDTTIIFDGAVNYTGEVHEGTDIYYVGNGARRNRIIVIDPGHQAEGSDIQESIGPGSDVTKDEVTWGATGVHTKQDEHVLNLSVALLLRDELIKRGYSVVMIRETADVDISNMERALIANKYNAAAYIRIHANAYDDPEMKGAMTICQSKDNPFPKCAAQYELSHLLSERLLKAYCSTTGIEELNVREYDNYTGTNWSEVPTTIIEMGFLSNESDDMYMATANFQQRAATGMADGIDNFIDIVEVREQNQNNSPADTANGNGTQSEAIETLSPAVTQAMAEMSTEAQTEGVLDAPTSLDTSNHEPNETPAPEDETNIETSPPTEDLTEAEVLPEDT